MTETKKVNHSIIFYLGKSLLVYSNNHVNHTDSTNFLPKRIYSLTTTPLNLAQNFEDIWKNLWPEHIFLADSIYFLQSTNLNQLAGFTDSRIIYLWLQNLKLFYNQKQIYFAQVKKLLDEKNINKVLKKTQILDGVFVYSSSPKIGKSS